MKTTTLGARFSKLEDADRALKTGDYSRKATPGSKEWESARYEVGYIWPKKSKRK